MIFSLAVLSYIAIFISFLYRFLIYPLFVSPLSKLPRAHPTSSVLPTWLWYQIRSKHEMRSITEAHRKHGSIVLLAPNEVSVASLDGLKKVYSGRRFKRPRWFVMPFMNFDGTPNLVTMSDTNEHAKRKKTMLQVYVKTAVMRSTDFHTLASEILSKRFLPILKQAAETAQAIEVYELLRAVSVEIGSAYEFGLQNSLDIVRLGREDARREYIRHSEIKMKETGDHKASKKWLETNCMAMCVKADAQLKGTTLPNEKPPVSTETTFPVAYTHLDAATAAEYTTLSTSEKLRLVASELIDNLEASREGDGITLLYVLHELSKHPELQRELRQELEPFPFFTSDQAKSTPITAELLQSLDRLPLLDAIIKETMRLHALTPGLQRRDVPPGGVTVDGYFIPGGAVIGTAQFIIHRNEQVFPNAQSWIPHRWTQLPSEKVSADLDPAKWWWGFGSGAMSCSGKDFAVMVMKLVLTAIYTEFDTEIADDSGIEQVDDGMFSVPAGGKLIIRFKNVA